MNAPKMTGTERVLAVLRKAQRPMSQVELRVHTGMPARSLQNALSHLLEDGRVERRREDPRRTRASVYALPAVQPPNVAKAAPWSLDLPNGVLREKPAIAPTWPAPRGMGPFRGWPLIAAPFHREVVPC